MPTKSPVCPTSLLTCLLSAFFLLGSAVAQNEKPYLIIPNTTSPDGIYAVAWGSSKGMLNLSSTEALRENLDFDTIENYLIDLRNGNLIATLDTSFFGHDDFAKNHGYLNITWRGDSKAVIVSESGKWATLSASVIYIVDPKNEWDPCSDLIPFTQAARRLSKTEIAKQFPSTADNYAITLTPDRWVDDQSVLINVLAEVPKSLDDPTFEKSLVMTLPSPNLVTLASNESTPGEASPPPSKDFLITPNSAGPIRLGMTVRDAVQVLHSATFTRSSDGKGIALISVQRNQEELMTLHAGEWDPNAPIDINKKIELISVRSARFITEDGVRVGMELTKAPRTYGALQEIMMSEIESREYARFTNQPSGLQFQVFGDGNTAGAYPAGNNLTANATPGAWLISIDITGRHIMDDGGISGIKTDATQADLLKTASAMNFGEVFKGKDEIWEAFGQAVQTWMFPHAGVSFDMISDEIGGSKSVFSITLKNPSNLKTNLGIGIGDPKERVLQAYSEYSTSDEGLDGFFGDADAHLVGSIYGGMIIYFENGVVSEIFLGAAAE